MNSALAIAGTEGQRIWTITQDNLSTALAAINLSNEIESEIRNAVLAGKVATAHEQPINFAGGTNTGYLLIDPDTGAYLIAGGANGGFLDSDFADILGFIGFGAGLVGSAFSLPLLTAIAAAIAILLVVNLLINYLSIDHRCSGLGGLIGLALLAAFVGVFAGGVLAIVIMYGGLLAAGGATTAANSSICRS